MALGFELFIRVRDEDGDASTMTLRFPDALALVDITDYADAFLTLLDAVIDGKIEAAGVCVAVTLPGGLKASPVNNTDVQHGMQFLFRAGTYPVRLRVPTWDPALIVPGSKNADMSDSDVLNFRNAILAGLTPDITLVEPSDNRGADVDAWVSAVENFRR
jgi:hypothetical protein